jgi:hypothetical protein
MNDGRISTTRRRPGRANEASAQEPPREAPPRRRDVFATPLRSLRDTLRASGRRPPSNQNTARQPRNNISGSLEANAAASGGINLTNNAAEPLRDAIPLRTGEAANIEAPLHPAPIQTTEQVAQLGLDRLRNIAPLTLTPPLNPPQLRVDPSLVRSGRPLDAIPIGPHIEDARATLRVPDTGLPLPATEPNRTAIQQKMDSLPIHPHTAVQSVAASGQYLIKRTSELMNAGQQAVRNAAESLESAHQGMEASLLRSARRTESLHESMQRAVQALQETSQSIEQTTTAMPTSHELPPIRATVASLHNASNMAQNLRMREAAEGLRATAQLVQDVAQENPNLRLTHPVETILVSLNGVEKFADIVGRVSRSISIASYQAARLSARAGSLNPFTSPAAQSPTQASDHATHIPMFNPDPAHRQAIAPALQAAMVQAQQPAEASEQEDAIEPALPRSEPQR